MDRTLSAVLSGVCAARATPWGRSYGASCWPCKTEGDPASPSAYEPPHSLASGDAGTGAGRPGTMRLQGQRPSISTSSEKLRNVLMSTISPRTATFWREG